MWLWGTRWMLISAAVIAALAALSWRAFSHFDGDLVGAIIAVPALVLSAFQLVGTGRDATERGSARRHRSNATLPLAGSRTTYSHPSLELLEVLGTDPDPVAFVPSAAYANIRS